MKCTSSLETQHLTSLEDMDSCHRHYLSDTPAVDSGVKQAQVFVGRDALVADAYPMKSRKQFVNTLEDKI